MSKSVQEALNTLRCASTDGRLDVLANEHHLRVVTVFGSATHSAGAARDLDVAVAYDRSADPDPVRLSVALMDLLDSNDVDLLVLNQAPPVARENALVPAVPLYERAPGDYARMRDLAVMERLDTQWLRDLELARLAGTK